MNGYISASPEKIIGIEALMKSAHKSLHKRRANATIPDMNIMVQDGRLDRNVLNQQKGRHYTSFLQWKKQEAVTAGHLLGSPQNRPSRTYVGQYWFQRFR